MLNGEDDAALAEAWRRGDPVAARRVVTLHGPAIMRVALALCPRVEDAEDAVQDALLQAFRSLRRFDASRGSLRAWLVAVAANRARQVRRAWTRYSNFLSRIQREPYAPAAAAPTHGDLAFARERLAALPAREREAFVLVEIEELTSIEAARAMSVSDSTVRVLVSRARGRLRESSAVAPARSLKAEGRGL